jgi:hypothetical protein
MIIGYERRTRKRPGVAIAVTLAALLIPAAAHATLLVRSDGSGLTVTDKNALNDRLEIFEDDAGYGIINLNLGDIFTFDRQVGCSENGFTIVSCVRNGPAFRVALSSGDDTLLMRFAPVGEATVSAGTGNDLVEGHAGNDRILGFTGSDSFSGMNGDDILSGEDQSDGLLGGNGDDELSGGAGSDALDGGRGADVLRGGAGIDTVNSREPSPPAVRDTLTCGTGLDSVVADLQDRIFANCEQRDIAAVGETPVVKLPSGVLDVSRSGVAPVVLRCPRRTTIGCHGSLSLRLARSGLAQPSLTNYTISAGRSATVRVGVGAAEARRINGRVRGILTSLESGELGPKTTIRWSRLRRADSRG